MKNPVVYVTQDVMVRSASGEMQRKFDLTKAAEFGEIHILVPHGQSLISSVPVVRQLRERLRNFTQDDFLLPIGDPAIMAAASAIASSYSNGRFNVLKWDRREGVYLSVPLDLSGKSI